MNITNSLPLIRELEENIAVIRGIIESLDIPVKEASADRERALLPSPKVTLMNFRRALGRFIDQRKLHGWWFYRG